MKTCTIDLCDRDYVAKGMCRMHYLRNRKYGNPHKTKYNRHSLKPKVEYKTWVRMKLRCYNVASKEYTDYGGRGIRVCNRWLDEYNGFDNFLNDMGYRPAGNYSIDRIDNDGDYTPNNCRWATAKEQSNNRRERRRPILQSNNKSGFNGVSWSDERGKWVATIKINGKQNYLGRFDTKDEAISARMEAEKKPIEKTRRLIESMVV